MGKHKDQAQNSCSINFSLFIVVRGLNMRSTLLTNLQVHNMALLTIGTVLYSRSPETFHLA